MKSKEIDNKKGIGTIEVDVEQNPTADTCLVAPGKLQLTAGTEVVWKVYGKEPVLIEFIDEKVFGQTSLTVTPNSPGSLVVKDSAPDQLTQNYTLTCEFSRKIAVSSQGTEPLIIIGN